MNILLTACGGPSGICFALSLAEIPGVRLVGISAENDEIGKKLVNSFHIVPLANDPSYLDALKQIIKDENIDIVIPFVDEEVRLLSEHASEIGCAILVSPFDTIRYTSNKRAMYTVASEYLPKLFEKDNIRSFPVFAKPAIGRGGKGAMIVHNAEELARISEETHVIQELLHNPEVSVDAMFDFDGRLAVAVPRIRAEIDQGISVGGEVFHDERLIEIVQALARKMKFVGPINFQFMQRKEEFVLTEINARGSGGMGITIRSGADMPKLVYELVSTGAIAGTSEIRPGVYANFDEVLERQRIKKENTP